MILNGWPAREAAVVLCCVFFLANAGDSHEDSHDGWPANEPAVMIGIPCRLQRNLMDLQSYC